MWNSRRPQDFISSGPTLAGIPRYSSYSASRSEMPMLKLALPAHSRLSLATRWKAIRSRRMPAMVSLCHCVSKPMCRV